MRGYLCARRCADGHPAAPVARHSVARLGSGNVARPPERLDRVVGEAIATGGVAAPAAPGHPGPVARLRGQAARLPAACAAAWPAERLVAIRDRELTTSLAVLAGAIEITATGGTFYACGPPAGAVPGIAFARFFLPLRSC
jgi:hypothetical protein